MTSSSQNGNGPPWVRFARTFGVPTVGLAVVLWWLGGFVTGIGQEVVAGIQSQLAQTQALATEVEETRADLQEHSRSDAERTRLMMDVLRAICVNTSGSQEERRGCFSRD